MAAATTTAATTTTAARATSRTITPTPAGSWSARDSRRHARRVRAPCCFLTGYGGFEISSLPCYAQVAGNLWLERGGVFVIASRPRAQDGGEDAGARRQGILPRAARGRPRRRRRQRACRLQSGAVVCLPAPHHRARDGVRFFTLPCRGRVGSH